MIPTSWSSSGDPNGGSPRHRQKTGKSEISNGNAIDAGAAARAPRSTSSITSPHTARSPIGKQRIES